MNDIYKDALICDAIKEAITDFGKEHGINGMEYFADMLGYNGQNKSIQLHNRLSPANNDKFLKLDELTFIMKQMNKYQQKIILNAFNNKFGFYIKDAAVGDICIAKSVELSVQMGAFEVQGLLGLFAEEILEDLRDGKITHDEAKRLKKICTHMREKTRGIEDALEAILG